MMRVIFASFIGLSLAAFMPVYAEFAIPPNDGLVTITQDIPDGVISKEQELSLENELLSYERETSNQIAILFVKSLDGYPIDEAAVEIGRKWGVGTEKNNGILILASYDDREVMLATGYGMEGAVPDLVAHGIIERDITPLFREAKYYEGLLAAVDSLQKHIGGEYTAERYETEGGSGFFAWGIFLIFLIFDWLAALLSRSKSWWLGGIFGGIFGIVLTILFSWWISIPTLVLVGLLFDYIVSKNGPRRPRGPWRGGGGFGGWGGSSGSGGFKGFGGGSFGGGGARGKW